MRIGWMLGIMLAVGGIASAAQAQETNDHNIPTETQSRLQSGAGDLDWLNLIGLLWAAWAGWAEERTLRR